MNRTISRFLLPIASLTLLTAQAPPQKFIRAGASAPFFVSASLATATDGSIRWSAFAPMTRHIVQMKIAAHGSDVRSQSHVEPSEPCNERIITFSHPSGDVTSLDSMIESAKGIYRVKIVSVNEGFDDAGSPSTIIAGEILRVVRTTAGFPVAGVVYVPYPKADFRIGGIRFCNAGPSPTYAPQAGDELLIFAYDAPVDTTGALLVVDPQQLIFERNHQLFAARPISSDPYFLKTTSLRQVETAVKSSRANGGIVR